MWRMRVRESYESLQQLQSYNATYGVAKRCGYRSAAAMWKANPIIQGSTNPRDFGLARAPDINKILALPRHRGYSARGADMGRRSIIPGKEQYPGGDVDPTPATPPRLYLQRLRMVDGDYDTGGAYWGGAKRDLWAAFALQDGSAQEFDVFITCRAPHREAAQAEIRAVYPAAKFHKELRQVSQAAEVLEAMAEDAEDALSLRMDEDEHK